MAGLGLLGLAKWQSILAIAAVVFRTVGGPTLVSTVLKTPGYIFGRGVRSVEWDVEASPRAPSGHMVRV